MRKILLLWMLFALGWEVAAQKLSFDESWKDSAVVNYIEKNIEKHRKGEATISIVGKNGKQVTNVKVEVHQQTHEFLFGCNLFVLGQLQTPELNTKYETAFAKLFNFATIPFYWKELEPQEGKPRFQEGSSFIWRRPPPDQLLKWCKVHHIVPKGHALMYNRNAFMPDWTERNNPELFLKQAQAHIEGIANRYKNDILVWDVVNEERYRTRNLETGHKVPDDYLVWCFKVANRVFPENVKLLYNDDTQNHDNPEEYEGYVNSVVKSGLRIDGMGLQFHLFDLDSRGKFLEGTQYPVNQLIEVYDRLGKLGLPIYITEITVPGGGEDGASIQAKIVENLYRLWFSVPNMAGITWWNLGDSTAFGNENKAMGGLLDNEMNPKLAYQALNQLINHEWKTNLKISSGSHGNVSFRGFYGKYKITVSHNGKSIEQEINLTKTGNNKFVIQL